MIGFETDLYRFEPHPDLPGWMRWCVKDKTRFNAVPGDLAVRQEGERVVIRMQPCAEHSNFGDMVHGGALMTLIDNALFIAPRAVGNLPAISGVTVDLSTQFVGAADLVRPIDLTLEILRETGRMMFMRGIVAQGDDMVASFMGIIRKSS